MAIPLPDLHTKEYKDISNEILESIPKYTDKWTNHNPTDPGITILEMLAWIGETILYRIDRVPEETYVSFLRLVAGAAGLEDVENLLKNQNLDRSHKEILSLLKEVEDGKEKSVEEIKAAVLVFLSSRFRAVTEEDFRLLAIEATDQNESSPKVKRAIVSVNDRKVEIIIVPDCWSTYEEQPERFKELIKHVSDYLDPRRLIGTLVEVKKPVFCPINIKIKFVSKPYVKLEKVKENLKSRIENYLNPLVGGPEGNGWPYGRPLTEYEIAQIIEETEGVERTDCLTFCVNGEKKEGLIPVEGLILVEERVEICEVNEEKCKCKEVRAANKEECE